MLQQAAPQMAPQGSPQPQGMPQAAPFQMPSLDELKAANDHGERMMQALLGLTGKPQGKLTKKDVFGAAADMIKGGSFPTADQKQALIGELAGLPEDEPSLRQAIGQHLLRLAQHREVMGSLNAAG